MPSEMKVNKISPASGTAITLGDSGDTFTIPSGATIANSGTATGFLADNAVTTAKIADNAVTLAKMAGGTDGQVITYDASGNPTASEDTTTGYAVRIQGSGRPLTGHMHLTLLDSSSNLWIASYTAKLANDRVVTGGGSKSLSAVLTQLYIVLDSNSYDAGSINIMYW